MKYRSTRNAELIADSAQAVLEGLAADGGLYLPEQLLYYRISAGSITAMQANAGLERRRRRFHSGEMDTLAKLRGELPRKIYALAAAERILQERWIAKQAGLTQWEAELRQRWQQFDCKKDIPFKDKLRILWRHRRLDRK